MNKDEVKICQDFNKLLSDLVLYHQINNPDSFMYYHIPNGQKAGGQFLAKKICAKIRRFDIMGWLIKEFSTFASIMGTQEKLMGTRRGVPDYFFSWEDDEGSQRLGYLECKVPNGTVTPEQKAFEEYCNLTGIPHAYFYSHTQGLRILQLWGVLKESCIF